MRVYVLMDEYYNTVDIYGSEIVCICKTREQAVQRRTQMINNNLDWDWVIDDNTKDLNADLVRLFYGEQEDWDNYSELIIIESEVE